MFNNIICINIYIFYFFCTHDSHNVFLLLNLHLIQYMFLEQMYCN